VQSVPVSCCTANDVGKVQAASHSGYLSQTLLHSSSSATQSGMDSLGMSLGCKTLTAHTAEPTCSLCLSILRTMSSCRAADMSREIHCA